MATNFGELIVPFSLSAFIVAVLFERMSNYV